jgi:hypothetical protein
MKKEIKKHFDRIKQVMEQAGTYAFTDDIVIEHAAETLALIDTARTLVKDQMQVFPTGAVQIAPQVNNLRGLLADFRKYADDLGLSPAARKKLDIKIKPQKQSALSALRPQAKAVNG